MSQGYKCKTCEKWHDEFPMSFGALNLKSNVYTRPVGQRPLIKLEPADHPLAVEQQEGSTMARVQEIVEIVAHDGASA
jgi:hypothetical protein